MILEADFDKIAGMKKKISLILFIAITLCAVYFAWTSVFAPKDSVPARNLPPATSSSENAYTGSSSCRPCHQDFYDLWESSHHGLAMQPCTLDLVNKKLKPQTEDIVIEGLSYRFVTSSDRVFVTESGPEHEKQYPVLHAMGGKNVYYFLTEMDKGRLQVLPVSYDVQKEAWFDTTASAVRHFVGQPDQPYHWTDYPYTFNTSCFGCHVSQLVNTYDLETDTYNTVWSEPGINCETCHGPAQKHIAIANAAADPDQVDDWALPVITPEYGYTAYQTNSACSNCHAKASVIDRDFKPGSDFYQHSDLVTLEHADYYPDGRDLGENYTYTSWSQSKCVKESDLHCVTCHTSSGRYRFHGEQANDACMPCHEPLVKDLAAHTHHDASNTKVTDCVQCHMPTTRFGNMNRSDHSMRSPMPSATIQFKSPNACNMCHTDQTPEWADEYVRKWYKNDYQKETLLLATWIQQLRQQNFAALTDILEYIQSPDRDEVYANSMIRLLRSCPDLQKVPALLSVLRNDTSPLCRSSAADTLTGYLISQEVVDALIEATTDPYLLVRMRAASTLSAVPAEYIQPDKRTQVENATAEYKSAMLARPDDGIAHFNLGNFYMNQGKTETAVDCFVTSIRLRPDFSPALLNASMAYNQIGQNEKALASLDNAIRLEPKAAPAHLNRALLLAEMKRYPESEEAFRATFKYDPQSAVAAYNLAVLLSTSDPEESMTWSRKLYALQPTDPKYAYTAAFYAKQFGHLQEAIDILQKMVDQNTDYPNAYMLLGDIFLKDNRRDKAIEVYRAALKNENLPQQARAFFKQQADSLTQ